MHQWSYSTAVISSVRLQSFNSRRPHQPFITSIMASLTTSLSRALPKPKYTGEEEELAQPQTRGPRILGANAVGDTQLVIKVNPAPFPEEAQLIKMARELVHRLMENERAGGRGTQKTTVMAARSLRSQSRNILLTWAESRRRLAMHSQYK